MTTRVPRDLVLVTGLAIAAILLDLVGVNIPVVRPILALALVLFLPGYGLMSASFRIRRLSWVELIAMSVGGSIVLTIITTLAMQLVGVALTANSWTIALGSLTVGTCIVDALRRAGPSIEIEPLRLSVSTVRGLALLGVAALVAISAVGIARYGALDTPSPGFTQLWLVPDASSGGAAYRIGVKNEEQHASQYRLELHGPGDLTNTWLISLSTGQVWQETYQLPNHPRGPSRIEVVLFDSNKPNVAYRSVWLDVGGG